MRVFELGKIARKFYLQSWQTVGKRQFVQFRHDALQQIQAPLPVFRGNL